MQSMLNLHVSCGLPLSIHGITHHFTLSKEIADHERRRRRVVKKQRSRARDANQEIGIRRYREGELVEIKEGDVNGDLATLLQDLSNGCLSCTAKAA